mgnify:CR=1 FL=1
MSIPPFGDYTLSYAIVLVGSSIGDLEVGAIAELNHLRINVYQLEVAPIPIGPVDGRPINLWLAGDIIKITIIISQQELHWTAIACFMQL